MNGSEVCDRFLDTLAYDHYPYQQEVLPVRALVRVRLNVTNHLRADFLEPRSAFGRPGLGRS